MSWKPETTTKTVTASFSGKKSYGDIQLLIDFVRLAEIDWAFAEFLPENERFAEPNKIKLEDGDYLVKYSFSGKTFERIMHVPQVASRQRLIQSTVVEEPALAGC